MENIQCFHGRWRARGRPKKHPITRDRGTPELGSYRLKRVSGAQDKTDYSTSYLDRLYAHGCVSRKSHEVANLYIEDARQALKCLQSPKMKKMRAPGQNLVNTPEYLRCFPQGQSTWSWAYEKAVLHRWQKLCNALDSPQEKLKTTLDDVLLFDRHIPTSSLDFKAFQRGLDRLESFYEGRG